MSTKNTTNSGKDGTPAHAKQSLQSKTTTSNPRPPSPSITENENEEFQTLIEKAIAWKLMSKEDNCNVVLPNKLLRLSASAKENGRTRTSLNEILDRIVLIAKILQEWSWKDKPDEWRKALLEHMEEEITTQTDKVTASFDGIARESRNTWKKLQEMAGQVTELSTKIATLGNTIPVRQFQTAEEDSGTPNGLTGTSYANAARSGVPPRPIQHHYHNSAVREAEMKDRRIVGTSQTPSDWSLGEKELVAKANLAIEHIVAEEGVETEIKPEVLAATKIASKGAFLLLRSVEEVRWIKQDDRME
ncbi:hypothetical protein FB446DRAFT_709007, partial [Lentinula raphanica]